METQMGTHLGAVKVTQHFQTDTTRDDRGAQKKELYQYQQFNHRIVN